MNIQIEKTPVSDEVIESSLNLFLSRSHRLLDKDLDTKLKDNLARAKEYGREIVNPFIRVKSAGALGDSCNWLLASIRLDNVLGFSLVIDHADENDLVHRFYFGVGVDAPTGTGFYSLSGIKSGTKKLSQIYKVDPDELNAQSITFTLSNPSEVA